MLQEPLRSARHAAQVPPLGCILHIRAQKRLVALDDERVKLVSELEEGQARLQRLRVEKTRRRQCFHQIGQRSSNDCGHS